MSEEPKPAMTLDPEMLAAYIDKRLTPEQRAAVEAQLASDPDAYAVLVESMKALDALHGEQQPAAPFVQKSKMNRRSWLIPAAVLAAAAAITLAVRFLPDRESNLAPLIEAVRAERPIEARLTGGFAYAPLAAVTRGPSDSAGKNLALLASAGKLQSEVKTDPSRATQRAWAAAELLIGQAEPAADVLTELLKDDAANASLHSDLAAALLTRVAGGESEQLALALEHATTAARLDPRLPEAAFNHAIALERASLLSQALEEWRRYQEIEPDANWRAEADQHIRDLERRLQPKPSARVPSSAAELIAAAPRSDVTQSRTQWRTALEGRILIDVLESPTDAGWAEGLRLARQLQESSGDALPLAIWSHARQHQSARTLLEGFKALQRGHELLGANQLTQAQASFRAAGRLLRETGSPAVAWTEFYEGHCLFFEGHTREAIELFKPLAARSNQNEYYAVALLTDHELGLGWLRMGMHATVLDVQQRVTNAAARLGDDSIEIKARSEVADAFERLSMRDASWKERAVILNESADGRDPSVRHVVTVGASRSAAAEGLFYAAEAFALAALDNGQHWKNLAAQAEARIRLADVANRRKETDRALGLLQEAEANLNALPDSAFADGWRADLEILRADAALARSNAEASAAGRRAFDVLARRSSPFRLARARWVQGRALERENPQLARDEFLKGLNASAAQQAAIDPFGRSLAEQRWLLLKEILSLPPASNAADSDLPVVLSTMLADQRPNLTQSIQAALTPDAVLLVFVDLENELLRWRVTTSDVERASLPVSRTTLERMVNTQARLVRLPASNGWLEASDQLSQMLFSGLRDESPATLTVITDELLSGVTFATLRWPGTRKFLLDTSDVNVLAAGNRNPRRNHRRADRALVIGDPQTAGGTSLLPLPGAREESRQIAALYSNVSLLIGPDATRDRLVAELPTADIVHYAGHAVGDRTDPSSSRLLLAADDRGSSFNAAEIVQLHVNARVVVLAACQGALAASAGNVPVRGLASAFLKAGAENVVASQWDIDDRQSTTFLRRLHHWLVAGVSPSRALRLAQSELRQDSDFSHPYYWAGFGVYTTIDSPNGDLE